MRLTTLGNQNAKTLELNNGTEILFSYETPVAAKIQGEYYQTTRKYSRTTTKHINQFVGANFVNERDQDFFEDPSRLAA